MKKKWLTISLSLLALIAVLAGCGAGGAGSSAAASSGEPSGSAEGVTTVRVGTMGTYSPFSYTDEDGKLTGYDLEVVRKVEQTDPSLHFEFTAGPWGSCP